jgi:type VI secretion system protein ImpL
MMHRIREILTSRTAFLIYGWLAFAAFLLVAAALLELPFTLAFAVLAAALLLGIMVWSWRRYRARRAASQLGSMLEQQAVATPAKAEPAPRHAGCDPDHQDVQAGTALRQRRPVRAAVVHDHR